MAAVDPALQDPLLALRRAIAADSLPTPTTTADLTLAEENSTDDIAKATHLYFRHPVPQIIPLSTPTRFVSRSSDSAVDLRSIYLAWQKKDVVIPIYIASAEEVNDALSKQKPDNPEKVQNLIFVERLDLLAWLEGASDESEYIRPLEGAAAAAAAASAGAQGGEVSGVGAATAAAAAAAGGKLAGGGAAVPAVAQHGRAPRVIDPRLQEIYKVERRMGDRNTVLRGIKPTVCFLSFTWKFFGFSVGINPIIRTSPMSAKLQNPSSVVIALVQAHILQA